MAKPSLNKTSSYTASLPHNGFDIGRKMYFTASTGMILPVYHQLLNPGEKISFNAASSLQCQPMVRPADLNLRQKIDVFFVPMQMLYTPFGQYMYDTRDFVSSSATEGGFLPKIDFASQAIWLQDAHQPFLSGMPTSETIWENASNYLSPLRFDRLMKGTFRLLMHLGYNPFTCYDSASTDHLPLDFGRYQPEVFPAYLAAYQCIYQHYYRDDDREELDIRSYQLDYLQYGGAADSSLFYIHYHQRPKDYYTSIRVSPVMSTLNTQPYSNDFNDLGSRVLSWLDNGTQSPSYPNGSPVGGVHDPISNRRLTEVSKNSPLNLTTQGIRTMFAVEKLLRISGRAKKNYDSQVLAHLGYDVPRDIKHEVSYLGGIDGGARINKIYSTSNTAYNSAKPEESNLGEIGGNGVGNIDWRNAPIKFTAPCHGILMAVYYCVPEGNYTLGRGIDKTVMLRDKYDFYTPEFDRLGDQPLFGYEVTVPTEGLDEDHGYFNALLGWQRRYEQYKRKYDVHTLAFYNPSISSTLVNTWSPWVLGRSRLNDIAVNRTSSTVIGDAVAIGQSFLVSPTDLNNLFVQKYNTEWDAAYYKAPWLAFQTDPFMIGLNIDCKLVSTMSVTGEPELW